MKWRLFLNIITSMEPIQHRAYNLPKIWNFVKFKRLVNTAIVGRVSAVYRLGLGSITD